MSRNRQILIAAVGLIVTLGFESLSHFKVYTFPAGVTISGLSMVLSFVVFFVVSWLTRANAAGQIDRDIRLIMDA